MHTKIPFADVKNFITEFEVDGRPGRALGLAFFTEFCAYFDRDGRDSESIRDNIHAESVKRIIYTEFTELKL